MGIVKWIEDFDSRYGIPRPAEFQHIPPFHAFLRIVQHGMLMLLLVGCGILSAYLLWLSAGYLHVTPQVRLYFAMGMILVLVVGFAEAAHEVIPYYRIKQRLTYGTARWADEDYLRNKKLALKVGDHLEGLVPGSIRVGTLRKGYDLVLDETEWLRHIAIFGPPGSGKSTTFLMNILRDISRGASAIVLDPKGELYEQTAHYFDDVYRLDLLNPECSDRWNFVVDCKGDSEFAHQMAATMIGLEGTKHSVQDPFWQESELLLLTAILLHLPNEIPEPTPPMIYEYLGMRDLKRIDGEMSCSKDPQVRLAWGAFDKAPPQTQGSVITGLMNKLQAFQIRSAQAVCAPITEGDRLAGVRRIEFKKLRRPRTAIYVVVAEGDATRYKNLLSTFFGQAVNQLRLDRKEKNPSPVCLCLDEAANVPIVGLKEIAGVGRGRRIGLLLGYQNMPQVQDQYGHDGANAILGSVGTTIFLPGLDDATSQFASRRIGQTSTWSRTTIDAHGKSMDSERQSETGRALMDATELRQMVKHSQCVIINDTAPPIRAGYPVYAVRKERARAPEYGTPRLVSLLEAEHLVRLATAQGMEADLTAIVAKGEAAAGFLSPNADTVPVAVTGELPEDAVYKEMFDRLSTGLPAEDQPQQSALALLITRKFREDGTIISWQDIKSFELSIRASLLGKTSVPVSSVAVSSSPPTVDVSGVAGLTPPANGNGEAGGGVVFLSNDQVESAFLDTASTVVREGATLKPILSSSYLKQGSLIPDHAVPANAVDALR
jgi:type IV secretory pathway TraG/TraD family ATPase VirD4